MKTEEREFLALDAETMKVFSKLLATIPGGSETALIDRLIF